MSDTKKEVISFNLCTTEFLKKYYTDFYLDQSEELKIGFTEDDRKILRTTIRSITNDILGTIK